METNTATTIFDSLSSGVRLDAFRLLVRKGSEGMVAGVLIEVPVMLMLVEISKRTAFWFPREPEKASLRDPRCRIPG